MAVPKDQRLKRLRELRRYLLRVAKRARFRGADSVAKRYRRRARFALVKIRRRREWLEAKDSGDFHPWMLNGRPGNIEPQVEREIARAVTQYGLVVTSTSTGGHTPSSYHFPWNNPRRNGKGRAVDLAGSWKAMCDYSAYCLSHTGEFDEAFGPPNTRFVKHGSVYNGSIPAHFNHNHVAPRP